MLSRSDLAAARKRLLTLAQHATEVRSELDIEERQAAGDGTALDPYRPAELHNEAAGEVVTTRLRDLEAGVEREALLAVERIDAGTYGVCERCSQPIPKGRLEALPYARTCVRCAG